MIWLLLLRCDNYKLMSKSCVFLKFILYSIFTLCHQSLVKTILSLWGMITMPSHYSLCFLLYSLFLILITKLLQSLIITILCRWCRKSSGWIQETALPLGKTLWYPWHLLMIILCFKSRVLSGCQWHLFGSLEFSLSHISSKVVMLQY